jgi:eukaryotic-like serine/threonine-protein kinase
VPTGHRPPTLIYPFGSSRPTAIADGTFAEKRMNARIHGPQPDAPGAFGGRFVAQDEVGSGGQSAVLRALDLQARPDEPRIVALKVVLGADDESRRRFLREYTLLLEHPHPNVVPVLTFGEESDRTLWYAMPLARQSLETRLAGGALKPDDAVNVVRQVCQGVTHLHEVGIVHRDIKPGNVLELPASRWIVSDLGYARSNRETTTRLTESGAGLGTLWYCAPEQLADAHRATNRSDIYSLGRLCQEVWLGYESNLDHLDHEGVRAVLRRATATDPEARQATVASFLSQLENALRTPPEGWRPSEPWNDRRERLLQAIRNTPLDPSTMDEVRVLMREAVTEPDLLEQFEPVLVEVTADQVADFWTGDQAQLRAYLTAYAGYVVRANYQFSFTDRVADFWDRSVQVTVDPLIRGQALSVLGELGPRHNRWHVRDVFAKLLQEVRTPDEATYAEDSLRELDVSDLAWSLEGLNIRTLHPMLQNAIDAALPEP